MPLIVVRIAEVSPQIGDKLWLSKGGLVNDVFFIGLFGLAVPLARFIDPWEIYLKIRRWYYLKPKNKLKMYGQS